MCSFEDLTGRFASRITEVAHSREYTRFPEIMEDLNTTNNAIVILAQLLGSLPGSYTLDFLLLNLDFLRRWTIMVYRELLDLVCDSEIAMYHVDHFLMMEGGLEYDTRADLWAGRYNNISRHHRAVTFRNGETVLHTDDLSLLARMHEHLGVGVDDLRAFQCDLRRKVTNARAS